MSCFHGQKEFTALYDGRDFLVPCHFVIQTTRHLKQMLESGAARYLFPLDADHAHLAIPAERWREKYSTLPVEQILPEALRDPTLVALYHTAEHLAIGDHQNDDQGDALNQWRAKRNVVGFFDGRPLKVLPPLPSGEGHDIPEQHANVGTLNFLAHRLGEIVFSVNGKAISFDVSFADDFRGVAPEERNFSLP